jgi:hypothetical protein
MGHDNGSFPNRHSSIYIVGEAPKLRSWVQIPPDPLFPVVQLRQEQVAGCSKNYLPLTLGAYA